MKKYHYSRIDEYSVARGAPVPEHPLLNVVQWHAGDASKSCGNGEDVVISTDFYSISLKHVVGGDFYYGRTKYDCRNGSMIFTSPNQEVLIKGVRIDSSGHLVVFHKDYLQGHELYNEIKKFHYFSYAVHEALHLSPKEEKQISRLFDAIADEYHNNLDEYSKKLILDLITTMLRYANRFYKRQFLLRQESQNSLYQKFMLELKKALNEAFEQEYSIPTVEQLAASLCVTPRYLSDALKVETGKTAKDLIHLELIDSAKELLQTSDSTISEIAYQLGFEYPNYFARLFKKKVGLTPSQFRKTTH